MSLVEKLQNYLATMASDFPASLELLSEEIVWINRLPDNVPFGGEYHGRDGVASYLTLLAETFVIGSYPFEEFDIIEKNNTLVLVGYEKDGKVLPTDTVFDLHFVWVVKFNDMGQICFLQEHNDTAAISNAFRS